MAHTSRMINPVRHSLFWPVLLTILAVAVPGDRLAASDETIAAFESSIQPILKAKCGKCHNPQKQKGGLDLSTMATVRRGGESGEPAVSEQLEESLLWIMIDGGDMPPEGEPRLTGKEKSLIRIWIEAGSPSKSLTADAVTQHDVLPYLYARCVVCHGRTKQEGGLDLRTVESILRGGTSGPAVTPGRPHESLLLKRVHAKDMPPPRELIRAGVRPLEPNEIDLITKWVAQGAKKVNIEPDVQTTKPDSLVTAEDRQFWAFQTPLKPAVPRVGPGVPVRNPVDAFLLTKLDERGLEFSAEASRRTLIRRVAFDLTGLPPDWEDVQHFLADESDDWYTRLVDYFLASPHYGERWGRYWLDVCGYADSEGKRSADPIRPHAWRYRDYVVRSLNDDKSYNRFLLEQIAGDELYDFQNAETVTQEMADALIATGFLRMAPDGTGSDIVDTVDERFEVVADEIDVLGSAVLGLTLRCAQCHTHKYDPIPQRDYFRLVAVFQAAYDVYDWLKPTSVPNQSEVQNVERRYLKVLPDVERQHWDVEKRRIQGLIASTRRELKDREAKLRSEALEEQLAEIPKETRDHVRRCLQTPRDERTQVQKELAERYEGHLVISDGDLRRKYPDLAKLRERTRKQVKELRAMLVGEPMIRALWDRGEPSPTWIFRRGESSNPGQLVGPGVLSVLSDGRTPFELKPRRSGSTGRRLAFAEWLLDPKHPLTARVAVNRVWFHHFGRGIVESLANFGKTGAGPSHPELLDWLAVSFVENGWSLKWLHREILNSAAYRQTSQLTPRHDRLDPDNRWLSRMPLRRLEAESVRDSLLSVAGQLNQTPFGEPDSVTVRDDGLVTSVRGKYGWRRTVYVLQRRKEIPTILETFDLPQMIPNCVERSNSTVATQALHLRNNEMVRELSRKFASRVEQDVPADRSRQVERVYNIALSRSPTSEERELALQTLQSLTTHWAVIAPPSESEEKSLRNVRSAETRALANLCHVIMNSAEFLFVD